VCSAEEVTNQENKAYLGVHEQFVGDEAKNFSTDRFGLAEQEDTI